MASSSNSLPLIFIFFIIACFLSSHQTLARESQFFFSKATRPSTPSETPTLKGNKEEPSPTDTPQSQHGYGLYGHGPQHFSPTTTTTTTTATPDYSYENNKFYRNNGAQFNPDGYKNMDSSEYYSKNNAAGYYNQDNIPENEVTGGSYRNSMEFPNSDHGSKQYGMSDTRMMENGNYFYGVNGGTNNPNEYYGSFRGVAGSGNYAYGVDNINNGDHSNNRGSGNGNFMEGYQNKYQESQEEYAP